ncbi:transmembrane protein, putative (macronuclear) [Tetrahymena thermophila SB210]|uniref:Transmembrane protein, putative n=1 Tax=Tetrahymena thermophila (strain SB210) TaxID=312017 RepID=Q22B10_TETTS|nr:transmembrane protein, putative [Tetrahymena thermophila SB210]EAR82498.2 transmembrane protein, putative [Tetrahymena thermophila SB210]|eukprot:XP_001030161.2 transmembrane protein, putative [Tetrahymena thermophila SB210]
MKKLYIFMFAILIAQVESLKCGQGCQTCSSMTNSQIPICTYCSAGYQLSNGDCIYQDCQPNLYFQIDQTQEDSSIGNCSSICDPLFNTDDNTKTCQKLVECSSIYSTQPNFLNAGIPTDFFIYQQIYYVAFQQGYLSIYDKNLLGLIKNLSYEQDDLTIFSLNGSIIVLKKDFTINIWDIVNERRYYIDQTSIITINQQTKFTLLLDSYLLAYKVENQSSQFQIIYDFASPNQIVSNFIQINETCQFTQVINNFLFLGNSTNLIVYQISFQAQKGNLNFTQLIYFSFKNQGDLQSIIQSNNSSAYFAIFTNKIAIIDIGAQTFLPLTSLTSIKKVKYIPFGNQLNDLHLIILTQQNLIDYSFLTQQQNIILSEAQTITDFDVGNFSGTDIQLAILSNSSILEIYHINNNIYNQYQIISLKFTSQSLKKIPIQYNSQLLDYQTKYEIVFYSSTSIQIIRESNIQQQYLEATIIENYNLPFPSPSSQVNSLVFVYSPELLISCHQNGDIIFYDASRQTNIYLIQKLNLGSQPCNLLQRFSDNKIVALAGQNVLFIDPSQQIILNKLTNLTNIVQITSNNDKLAIIYSNCIQIISSEFKSLFLECQSDFSSNNLNIALNNDLTVFIQKQSQIAIYQIDLSTNSAQIKYLLPSAQQIQQFQAIQIFKTDQDTILNNYTIDEIVYFDSQNNFNICNMSLQIIYTVQLSLIQTVISVVRVINDASVYFLAGYQPITGLYRLFLVSKNIDSSILLNSNFYFPFISEPKKHVNGYGTILYSVKRSLGLSFFTLFKEYQVDINKNIVYITGHEYIVNDNESAFQSKMIGSTSNFLNYAGTQSGLIYTIKLQQNRYQELTSDKMLYSFQNNDQILEIIQSAYLGMYFILTKYQITSFNIFTNKFIEQLAPQQPNDPPFTSFSLVQNNKSIVCWNQYQLLYAVYGKTPQKYYYKGMSLINGWIYSLSTNSFYVYGSSLQLLNSQLTLIQSSSDQQFNNQLLQCQDASQVMVCSISVNSFVIVKKLVNQFSFQSVQVNGFTSQFMIQVDEEYNNIFLYDQQIQVYNLNGVYILGYKFDTQFISLSFSDTRLMFLSQSFLITNQYTFTQVFVYDSESLLTIAKINGSFPANSLGDVVDIFFDYSSAQITYLDTVGNVYIYDLYADFPLQSNFKITEVLDRNEQLVGLSYDNITNNLIIYSTQTVYLIDYTLSGYSYESQLNEVNNYFTPITINSNSLEFLLFNNDNVVFRYSKYNIKFENIIDGSQIVDFMYNLEQDIMIIAQKDQILFYYNYQFSRTNNQLPVLKVLKQIQFFKFLQYNIYLTYDKKIIYCNILTGEIIDFAQLQPSVVVTSNLISQNNNKVFIGLSNGSILYYDLINLSKQYFTIQNNNQINTSVICIILDESKKQSITLYFATNGGILQIIDVVNNKLIQQINLISLVNEDPSIILKDLTIDFTYSRYLGSIYSQESQILKLYGLHQQGIFENNFSISLYDNDQQFQCSIIISDDDISQLNRKISNISPKQDIIYTILGSSTQNQQNWENLIYLQNDMKQTQQISLSKNVQIFILQNITINNQCQGNFQINISNIQKVILQSVKISQLQECSNNNTDNAQPYFLNFLNIPQIQIYDLDISDAMIQLNKNFTLLNFKNINTIIIDSVNISNNQNINSFFQFAQINNITISNIKINNNQNIQQNNNSLNRLLQQQVQSIIYNLNEGVFTISQSQTVSIYKSVFSSNIAQNGGAIFFTDIQKQINFTQCLFQNNTAYSNGGALYFENIGSTQLYFDSQTIIMQNQALIGGGLRIIQTNSDKVILPQGYPFEKNIYLNKASIFGDNSATYLQKIIIQNSNTQNSQNDYQFAYYNKENNISQNYYYQVDINHFQSGGQLSLKMFIVDNNNRFLSFSLQKLLNNSYPSDISNELKRERILNYNQYNSDTQSFELTGLQIQGVLSSQQQFSIDSSIQTSSQIQLPILLQITFRDCQVGEIIEEQINQIMICKICQQGTYSLVDPKSLFQQSQNIKSGVQNECNNCPNSALECQGQFIQLKNGYWRQNNLTDEIVECNSQFLSCQAENPSSIEYCTEGYIGPICQQCDNIGEIWKGYRYSQSVKKGYCEQCYDETIQWIYFLLKIIAMIAYFLFTTFVFISQFKYNQTCYYLRRIKLLPISKSSISDYSGFYIKIVINYFQLSSLLLPQSQILPVNINILSQYLGQTSRQLSLGIECMVSVESLKKYGQIVFFSLVQFLMAIFLFILVLVILKTVQIFIKNKKVEQYHYFTFFHIFIIFYQIDQISYFSKGLTCEQVGSQSLNPYDLRVQCDDMSTIKFVYPYSIVVLLFWTLLPTLFLIKIIKNKSRLDECKIKYFYGYYYGELKTEYFYWEFIRIYLKIILIYIYILLQSAGTLSIISSLIFIGIYITALRKRNPFISQQIQQGEIQAYSLLIIKIYLSQIKTSTQSIQVFIEVVVILIDYLFFLICGYKIIVYKARQGFSFFSRLFRGLLQKFLTKRYFEKVISKKTTFKTYLNWKFIKYNIQKIIQLKASQNINIAASKLNLILTSQKTDTNENANSKNTKFSNQRKVSQYLSSDSLSSYRKNLSSDFKLLNFQQNICEGYTTQQNDYILESDINQVAEEEDTKNLKMYKFHSKQSILDSKQLNN